MKKYLSILSILLLLFQSCSFQKKDSSEKGSINKEKDTLLVDFWSGNRSGIRQDYEREVLKAILEATEKNTGIGKLRKLQLNTQEIRNQRFLVKNSTIYLLP